MMMMCVYRDNNKWNYRVTKKRNHLNKIDVFFQKKKSFHVNHQLFQIELRKKIQFFSVQQ